MEFGKCINKKSGKLYEYSFDSHYDGDGELEETYYVSKHDFDLTTRYSANKFKNKFSILEREVI